MRLDVFFTPNQVKPIETAGRLVVIVDVLRASTTVATALGNGARTVIPVEGADEVINRSKDFARSQILLAGEHKMYPIAGFDIGNSPQAFTPAVVEGKTIIITTTNGTRTLLGVQNARDIVIASYVNFSAALVMMKVAASSNTDIAIICAGEEGSFTLEDAACAGRYVRAIPKKADKIVVNDAAAASVLIEKRYGDNIAKVFKESSHGQALASAGFGDDLAAAAEVDSYPVVPIYQDRQITKLGPERAR